MPGNSGARDNSHRRRHRPALDDAHRPSKSGGIIDAQQSSRALEYRLSGLIAHESIQRIPGCSSPDQIRQLRRFPLQVSATEHPIPKDDGIREPRVAVASRVVFDDEDSVAPRREMPKVLSEETVCVTLIDRPGMVNCLRFHTGTDIRCYDKGESA